MVKSEKKEQKGKSAKSRVVKGLRKIEGGEQAEGKADNKRQNNTLLLQTRRKLRITEDICVDGISAYPGYLSNYRVKTFPGRFLGS